MDNENEPTPGTETEQEPALDTGAELAEATAKVKALADELEKERNIKKAAFRERDEWKKKARGTGPDPDTETLAGMKKELEDLKLQTSFAKHFSAVAAGKSIKPNVVALLESGYAQATPDTRKEWLEKTIAEIVPTVAVETQPFVGPETKFPSQPSPGVAPNSNLPKNPLLVPPAIWKALGPEKRQKHLEEWRRGQSGLSTRAFAKSR